jgi:hypothetical protein
LILFDGRGSDGGFRIVDLENGHVATRYGNAFKYSDVVSHTMLEEEEEEEEDVDVVCGLVLVILGTYAIAFLPLPVMLVDS